MNLVPTEASIVSTVEFGAPPIGLAQVAKIAVPDNDKG
jgi:hypothetical protein